MPKPTKDAEREITRRDLYVPKEYQNAVRMAEALCTRKGEAFCRFVWEAVKQRLERERR
jgi:hypothetical protein